MMGAWYALFIRDYLKLLQWWNWQICSAIAFSKKERPFCAKLLYSSLRYLIFKQGRAINSHQVTTAAYSDPNQIYKTELFLQKALS